MTIGNVRHNKGFTLLEILIVLVILGIVTAVVVMSMRKDYAQESKYFAEDLLSHVSVAEELAIYQSKVIGITVSSDSVAFYQYDPTAEKDKWVLIDNSSILKTKQIPSDLVLTFQNPHENKPDIIITNGSVTPFQLNIGTKDKAYLQFIGKMNGELSIEPAGASS